MQRYEIHFFLDSDSDEAVHEAADAAWAAFDAAGISIFEATASRVVDGHPIYTAWDGWTDDVLNHTAVRRNG